MKVLSLAKLGVLVNQIKAKFATKAEVEALETPNVQTIKVNNTALTPDANKAVNIDLSNYATKSDISSVYKYKGSVATYAELPSTGMTTGDVYNIEAADKTHGIKAGDNVAYDGTKWDVLAGTFDTSDLATKAELDDKVDKVAGKGLSTNDLTDALKTSYDNAVTKLANVAEGAQVNVIETVKVNNVEQTVTDKTVNISVPEIEEIQDSEITALFS